MGTIGYILSNRNWKDENYKPVHKDVNKGENNPRSKLTWEIVNEIRKSRKRGVKFRELSEKYGLSTGHISDIVTNKRWKDGKQNIIKIKTLADY